MVMDSSSSNSDDDDTVVADDDFVAQLFHCADTSTGVVAAPNPDSELLRSADIIASTAAGHKFKIFCDMRLAKLIPSREACDALLACFSKAKQVDRALRVFRYSQTVGYKHDDEIYNKLIVVCSAARKFDQAERIFRVACWDLGGVPSVRCYNSMITAYARSCRVGNCLELYKEMRECGVQPNTVTFTALITGCTNSKKARGQRAGFNTTLGLFRQMQALQLKPDKQVYTSMLDYCAVTNHMDHASEILDEMRNAGLQPNLITFNVLLKGAAKCGDISLVEQYFTELKQMRLRPTAPTFVAIFFAISRSSLTPAEKEMRAVMWYSRIVESEPAVFACKFKRQGSNMNTWQWIKPREAFERCVSVETARRSYSQGGMTTDCQEVSEAASGASGVAASIYIARSRVPRRLDSRWR
jgi:pentatricopeptide repeat protein